MELCPNCRLDYLQTPPSGQESFDMCPECGTVKFKYRPLPHQAVFHADTHKYKMFAGGYGSGKTTTACEETIDHIIHTPGGTTLIGAATLPQLEQTAMKEFFEKFPAHWIVHYNKQKNYLDTINGHRVIFRPLDDEGKARSLNLTSFWIEESSEVGFEYFTQLQTRLRNDKTKFHQGILSTNPDMGWIKTEFLLKAHEIYNSDIEYERDPEDINTSFSVHIAPTNLNTYLPPTFYEDTAKGKPDWWIRRFLQGSFENREGLVYPMYQDNIIEPFDIPKHWERLQGSDFGLADPTTAAWGAIDPKTGTVYLYDEYYQAGKPVEYHQKEMKKRYKDIPFGLMRTPVGDAKGKATTEGDMRSIFDHYAEYGIYFMPSTKKLEDSIQKKFGYLALGRLKIFNTLKHTIREFQNYRYPERKLDAKTNKNNEKPEDKDNHMMDAIRYMVAELPDDPDDLINPSYNSNFVVHNRNQEESYLPHALQTDENDYNDDDWSSYY